MKPTGSELRRVLDDAITVSMPNTRDLCSTEGRQISGANLCASGWKAYWTKEDHTAKRNHKEKHVNGNRTVESFPEGLQMVMFGMTGHAEVVRVVYQPDKICFEKLLKVFWESHDPTQGMRQGNDIGSQYRSVIYPYTKEQMAAALKSKEVFQEELNKKGYGKITTEIREGQTFYFAEGYHQQYLKKNPGGYCGLRGTGVSCPVGI
ncbi:mitochondrial peptide methionine sulfoxide reductase isoform X3 [Hypanus sabinus]|uniref:mitochondrial peptide methionine sulfoxide reductase isoform X3 n=1 Tax=Hypanus sabinus TaxID=79690 RepID=UPI0028C3E302|nr:mitochondrial peptide methionine sulfoxide reductase isoform X3 [Hypanus sabinus]